MTNSFGIYVHIPFCVHKCSYCDFYSFTKHGADDFERMARRLVDEIDEAADWLDSQGRKPPPATSIFFGGGTPSLMPMDRVAEILEALERRFPLVPEVEITLEANPETVDEHLAKSLFATSVNRVSLGAQSFDPAHLKALERLGSRDSIEKAVGFLRAAGFSNFSLDLIFGIPGQSEAGIFRDIDSALELGPQHLSFYNLTLKPAHPLHDFLPSDDESAGLYEAGIAHVEERGFRQYEISNFALPSKESRHNLLYWDGGDYLGLGPSAAGRFFWEGRFHHRKAPSDFRKYVEGGRFTDVSFESTTLAQTVLEAAFLELRKNSGVSLEAFRARYGYDLTSSRKFELFLRRGLLERNGDRLVLSDHGRLLADTVTSELVDLPGGG